MVIPRSFSRSIESSTWPTAFLASMVPVRERSRSARVDLPWSMWATMEKLRIRSMAILLRVPRPSAAGRPPEPAGLHNWRGSDLPSPRFEWVAKSGRQGRPAARPRAARVADSGAPHGQERAREGMWRAALRGLELRVGGHGGAGLEDGGEADLGVGPDGHVGAGDAVAEDGAGAHRHVVPE